jgi:hypothetical protein
MPEYITLITNGHIQRNIQERIGVDLAEFEGKRVLIKIMKLGSTRSAQANAYFHAMITIFSHALIDYTGDEIYKPELVKDMVKTKFLLKDIINEKTGEVIGQHVLRTRDLNKTDFAEFTDKVIRWAASEFHIVLPLPGEEMEMDL